MDSIDHWAGVVRDLEARLEDARQAALTARSAPSFFAFFRSGMRCLQCLVRLDNFWGFKNHAVFFFLGSSCGASFGRSAGHEYKVN